MDTKGKIAYSAADDVIELVLAHMTDEPNNTNISTEDNLAKEHQDGTAIQAKFDDSSLMMLLRLFRYVGIQNTIPIEDLHITMLYNEQAFNADIRNEVNYKVNIEKIVQLDDGIAVLVSSDDIVARQQELNLNPDILPRDKVPPLHFDICYDKHIDVKSLEEINKKLEDFKHQFDATCCCNREVAINLNK